MAVKVFVKKLQLIPVGEKDEKDRVYEYIRTGMYNQYIALNRCMSEVGTLYYHVNKDISSVEWKEKYREIFLMKNPQFDDIEQPVGLGMFSCVFQKVKTDFSTALKSGLAKGERQLPYYKRDFPLMVGGRFLKFYNFQDERDSYALRFVNGINFKVYLGSRGHKDYSLVEMLSSLSENTSKYKIGQSQITIKDGKIFLFLTLKTEYDNSYIPQKNKTLGVALGYSSPIICAFNDSNDVIEIGDSEEFISKRQYMQEFYKNLQSSIKSTKGGRGRKHKLQALERLKNREKNFATHYNHELSKKIVELAVKHNTECIILENIKKNRISDFQVLRNWSYYQLHEFIKYKAKVYGIKVLIEDGIYKCKCGYEIKIDNADVSIFNNNKLINCINCGADIEIGACKAHNLAIQ